MRLGYLAGALGLAVVMVGGIGSADAAISLKTSSLSTLLLSRQIQAKPTITTTSATSSSTKSSKVQAASASGPNIDSGNVIGGFQNIVDRLRAYTNQKRCDSGQTRFCVSPH